MSKDNDGLLAGLVIGAVVLAGGGGAWLARTMNNGTQVVTRAASSAKDKATDTGGGWLDDVRRGMNDPVMAARDSESVRALRVAPEGPQAGYKASLFPWADTDRNGCRNDKDARTRDLTKRKPTTVKCVVSGTLHDPYTGKTIVYVYTPGQTSLPINVDHVVARSDAWKSGAAAWPQERRTAFANDLTNLLTVDAATNQSKGDKTPAEWSPVNKAYACAYVRRYVQVKNKYSLSVTQAQRDSIQHTLTACKKGTP